MSKVLIANWKANPTTLDEAMELFDFYLTEISKYQNTQLVVCPPFVFLEELAKKLLTTHYSLLTLGAQDIFWEKSGPYTGETSTDMLKNFGVTHALIGHSDRRYKIGLPSTTFGTKVVLGETDEVINKKITAAFEAVKIIQEFIAITYSLKPKPCLYGASVNQADVVDFLKHSEISGAVIGG